MDDVGWADTSLYVAPELNRTPHIDRLAARGMRFTQAYAASPVCSPTRNSILTGLHPARTGMVSAWAHAKEDWLVARPGVPDDPLAKLLPVLSATRLRPRYDTLPEALKRAGYATGHFGKWHLGRPPFDPRINRFDIDVPGSYAAGPPGGYFDWSTATYQASSPKEHIEDFTATQAVDFIRTHKKRPFFLNYWMFSAHKPFEAKAALVKKYESVAAESGSHRSPVYAAMMETLDTNVGRILTAIDRMGLAENTIVILMSDNGGNVHSTIGEAPATSNAPLRGGKATLREGGIRVPLAVIWPGVVEPGTTSDAVVHSTDIFPTILDMIGVATPEDQRFDGISVVPALEGMPLNRHATFSYFPDEIESEAEASSVLLDSTPPGVCVRFGDFKLSRFFHDNLDGTHRYELYDLANDVGETTDLSEEMPEIVTSLDAMIDAFLVDTGAVVPQLNPAYVPPSL